MNRQNKHIKSSYYRTIRSLIKASIVLACILLFISTNNLFAQVINNNGAAISVTNGIVLQGDTLENTAGTITNNGMIGLRGHYINIGTTQGNGIYNIQGNWNNTGIFNEGTSTVNFMGSNNQRITAGGEIFYNLTINNTGASSATNRIILLSNVNIFETLTIAQGNVETGVNTLYLTNPLTTSLDYTSVTGSRVIGKFERGINVTTNYLFPLGSDDNYNPMNLNFNAIQSAGSVLSEFVASDPDSIGLPLPDEGYLNPADSVEVYNADSIGYWSVTANGFASDNFDVNLDGTGFTVPDQNVTRIIKRTAPAGDWTVNDGVHKDAISPVAYRNTLTGGIAGTGHHFGWGHIRPRIQTQPEDTAICDGESATFSIVATGRGTLTYEWEVWELSGVWQPITDDAIYANSNTDTLLIMATDLSMNGFKYRVTVFDSLGNFHRSNAQATLTVNPNPVITAIPQQDTICNGETTHIEFTSDVPGTTFFIEILNPTTTIQGANINLDGDTIKDVLTNPSLFADSVIYRIFPTGPGTTFCDGTADTVIIWVNPTPLMSVSVADTILCDSSTLNITVNDDLLKVKGTKVYQLTTTDAGGNVQGVQASGEYAAGLDISDDLINNTNEVQIITYTFRPRIDDDRNGGIPFCDDGRDTTLTIYVNPTPVMSVSIVDTILCDSTTLDITVNDDLLGVEGTKVYQLTTTDAGGNVQGVQTSGEYAAGLDISNDLVNNTNQVQIITYTFRPRIDDDRNGGIPFCDNGRDTTLTIYVNPTPVMSVTVADTILCDSTTLDITVSDDLLGVEGTKVYQLTTTDAGGNVQGVQTSGEYAAGLDISNDLVNNTNQVQIITYTFRPRIDDPRNGDVPFCDNGRDTTLTIYVNPTPVMSVAVVDTILCDSTTLDITINDDLLVVAGTKVYQLTTTDAGGNVQGVQISGEYAAGLDISNDLVNITDEVQIITYTFRPRIDDPRNGEIPFCDNGRDTTLTIYINPTPRVIISVLNDTICNDTYTEITLTTPSILTSGIVTFDYYSVADAGLTGNSGPLSNLTDSYIIADSLHNNTAYPAYPLVVRYNVTPRALSLSCADGPTITDSITVHPTADTYMIADSVVCYMESNGRASVIAENGINEFTYNWDDPFNHQTAATDSVLSIGMYTVTVTDNQGCTKTDSVLIEQPYRLIPVIDTVKNVSCFGVGNGYIVLDPTGGNGTYSYYWLPTGETTDSIGGLDGALYYATVTDWKGCAQDTIIEVGEPPQGSVFVDPVHVSCNGENDGTAEAVTVGPYTYLWSPTGETTARIENLSPGPYSVIATNAEGCEYKGSTNITEPDLLLVDSIISTRISCAGDADGTIDLYVSGGNTIVPYTYNWFTSEGTGLVTDIEDQTGLSGGWYYVTINDWRNCEITDSAYINEPPFYSSSITSNDVTCNGDENGEIDLTVIGGNTEEPYTFNWTTPDGTGLVTDIEDQTGLSGGSYYVIITDAKDCELYDTATIFEPDLLETFISETNVTCFGYDDGTAKLDILGGSGGYVISWDPPGGETTDSIYGLSAGTYYVTVTDGNACLSTNYVEITEPEKIDNNETSENITCFGYSNGEIIITPTGGILPYNYLWSHSSILIDSIADNLDAGNYSVSVIDGNNCVEISSIDITQPDPLVFDLFIKDDITCYGDEDGYISFNMFGGTPDYTYTWSNGYTETSVDMLSEGLYSINVTDIHNCEIDTTVEIVEPEKLIIVPVLRMPTCPDIQDGSIELNIAGGRLPYTIYWDNGSFEGILYEIRSGIYDVLINDSSFCEIDTSFIVRSAHDFCIEIPSAFTPNADNINDKWEIGMRGLYPNAEIEIFDRYGKRIFFSRGYEEYQYWDGTLNGKDLPMDAYYYIINLKNGSKRISGTITLIR